jgi:SRSO17 transposase
MGEAVTVQDIIDWDAEVLRPRARLRGGRVGSADAAVVADDTQAIKKGDRSVGVAPQRRGATGQIENCQVIPMLTYATEAGHAFIDRELYLPRVVDVRSSSLPGRRSTD